MVISCFKPIVRRYVVLYVNRFVAQFDFRSQAVRFCECWRPSFAFLEVYDTELDSVVWYWIY